MVTFAVMTILFVVDAEGVPVTPEDFFVIVGSIYWEIRVSIPRLFFSKYRYQPFLRCRRTELIKNNLHNILL